MQPQEHCISSVLRSKNKGMEKIRSVDIPIFRIFISSTFEDLKEERNALQRDVFPRLREFCHSQGADFQVIDLRWGIAEQTALNQQTVNICLEEIERCQLLSPKPNFLVLLGDRYGWCPPPAQIPADEYQRLLTKVPSQKAHLLEKWYRRDDNAIPPEFCLQPREIGGPCELTNHWQPVERELHSILLEAAKDAGIQGDALAKYRDSATHQEISAGALSVADADEHVLCFFRNIQNLPDDPSASRYRDFSVENGETVLDEEAQNNLQRLRETLRNRLGENVFEYEAQWMTTHPSADHIEQLCKDVYLGLKQVIVDYLRQADLVSETRMEQEAQQQYLEELVKGFHGREHVLDAIRDAVDSDTSSPIILTGSSGSGKSATLAKAVQQLQEKRTDHKVFYRFAGSTTLSSDATSLLSNLCEEIYERCGLHHQKESRLAEIPVHSDEMQTRRGSIEQEYHIPSDLRGLLSTFLRFLAFASREGPLIVVLDGLDKLEQRSVSQMIRWLPGEPPSNARLLLSMTSDEKLHLLQARLPEGRFLEMGPLTGKVGEQILDDWLAQDSRDLQPWQKQQIIKEFQEGGQGLPLYLKLAFEQARFWKSYTDQGSLTVGPDIDTMIESLFEQLSANDKHGPVLVSRVIGYLLTSRRGLSEDELLDLLSRDTELYVWFVQNLYHFPSDLISAARAYLTQKDSSGKAVLEPQATAWLQEIREDALPLKQFLAEVVNRGQALRLPIVLWARLYADLQPYLTIRAGDGTGLMRLSHQYMQDKVQARFLSASDEALLHQRMAAYFSEQRTWIGEKVFNLRKLSELPYQQTRAGLFDALKDTLMDFEFLDSKIQVTGAESVIEDYRRAEAAGCKDETLAILQGALELSAHVLDLDRQQLPGQLTGRLCSINRDEIQSFVTAIRTWKGRAWLRPLSSSLRAPGGALLRKHHDYHGPFIPMDGGSILIGAENGDLCRIDAKESRVERRLESQGEVLTPMQSIAGGQILVRVGDTKLGLWDLSSEKDLEIVGEAQDQIRYAAMIPAESVLLIAMDKGGLEAWNLKTKQKKSLIQEEGASIIALLPTQPTKNMISIHRDGTLRRWGISASDLVVEGECIKCSISPRHRSVTAAAEGLSEGELILGFMDGSVGILDLEQGEIKQCFKIHTEWVTAFKFFDDGKACMTGAFDGSLKVWETGSGNELASFEGHNHPIESITVLDVNSFAVTSSASDLKVWDLKSSEVSRQGERVTAIALFPDGGHAVAASDTRYAWSREDTDTYFTVLDLTTGNLVRRVNLGEHFWINDLDVFKDGRRVICAGTYWRNSLTIFNLKNGKAILPLPYHRTALSVRIYNQGSRIISGGEDNAIRIWDLDSFTEVACLQGHTNEINAICVFADESKAVSAALDGTLRVWDLETYQEEKVIAGNTRDITDLRVYSSGKYALSAGGGVHLWDLEKGCLMHTFPTDLGSSDKMADLADESPILSGTNGYRFSVFDPASGETIADFIGEGDGLTCSVTNPEGSRFVVGGSSGAVHVLELIRPE
jgi:WD40 repeat protein